MTPGTYRITLRVTETFFDGTATVDATVDVTVTIQIQPPGRVRLLEVDTRPGVHTELDVEWSEPDDDGGSPITEYEIAWRETPSMPTDPWTTYDTETYTVTALTTYPIVEAISELTENTEYQVRVRARNISTINNGYGPWSNVVSERTTTDLVCTINTTTPTVNKGDTVNFVATSNIDDVTYTWSVSPNLGSFPVSDSPGIQDWVAPYFSSLYQSQENGISDAYTITVTVRHDSTDREVSCSETVTVVNQAPIIFAVLPGGISIRPGTIAVVHPGVRIPVSVAVIDNDLESATVRDTVTIDFTHDGGSGPVPETTIDIFGFFTATYQWTLPAEPGTYTLTVTASDGDYVLDDDGNVIEATDERTVRIRTNAPSTCSITGPTTPVDAGTTHTLNVTINDIDNEGTDDEIDERYITFITNEGGGSYIGNFVRVSEGNYTQEWQAPNKKGTAVVEVQYQDILGSTVLSTCNAQASIEINNQAPEVRIDPETDTITTVQSLLLTALPLEGASEIDPDGDDVTFEWEIEDGIGRLQFGGMTAEEGVVISTGDIPSIIYTPPSPPDTPAAPTVEVVTADATMLEVSWVEPADNGSVITDYDLRYKLSTQDETHYVGVDIDLTDVTVNGENVTYTVDSLHSSRSYDFQVRASNIAGSSDWSPIGTGMTPNAIPTIDSFTTLDATIEINGQTFVDVVATDDDDDELYYEFSITGDPGDGSYGTLAPHASNDARQTYHAPDEPGDFEIQVQVFDTPADIRDPDITYPTAMLTIMVADIPDKPDPPTLTALTNDTTIEVPRSRVLIEWTAPAHNNSALTQYDVQYREEGLSIYTDVTLTNDLDTEATVTNLKPNTTYYAHVRARNSVSIDFGIGEWSDEGMVTTTADVPDKIYLDSLVVSTPEGSVAELFVDWDAPNDNGSIITDYDIQYRSSLSSTWSDWEPNVISIVTETTVMGLDESTTYGIRVRAVNAIGDGEWSDPANGVTGTSNTVPNIISFESDVDNDTVVVVPHEFLPEIATLVVDATDDEDDDLTYTFSLPGEPMLGDYGTIIPDSELPMATYRPPDESGVYTVQVVVSDGDPDLKQPDSND